MTITKFLLKITNLQINSFEREIQDKAKEIKEGFKLELFDDISALRNIHKELIKQKESLEEKYQIEEEENKINGEN